MFNEFGIGVVEQQIVVNNRLPGDNTEQMNQTLGFVANMRANGFTAGGGIEDGEVNVGIGVSRVEETAEGHRIWGFPEMEDAEDVDEVLEESAVFVPALAGADRAKDGDKRRQVGINSVELIAEEGTSRV